MTKAKFTVAQYLERQIPMSGKTQREIATEIGYANPNILTMFKTGATKIPINKVGALAGALGVDPAYMLRLVLTEYLPETWSAIEDILGRDNLLTEQDRMVIACVREAAGNQPFDLSIEENYATFRDAVKAVVVRDKAKGDATVKRVAALPPNIRNK